MNITPVWWSLDTPTNVVRVTYNNALSERRAALIRDYLVAKGVPANEITIRAEGKDKQIDQENVDELLSKGDTKPAQVHDEEQRRRRGSRITAAPT